MWRFPYPPDSPETIDDIALSLRSRAQRVRENGHAVREARRALHGAWAGAAGDAALGRYSTLVDEADEVVGSITDSIAAVVRYRGQIVAARSVVDEIRESFTLASARLAALDTEVNRSRAVLGYAVPAEDSAAVTMLLVAVESCENAYTAVMRRVAAAAAACSEILLRWEDAGPTALAPGTPAAAVRLADREDPNGRILNVYQVTPDPEGMIQWSPSSVNGLVAWLAGKTPEPREMTEHEGWMLDRRPPEDLYLLDKIRNDAFDESRERFPPSPIGGGESDHNDAFRHAYWSSRQTQFLGAGWAEEYTTSHERMPDNPPEREAMDLYNNEVGRRIAEENRFLGKDELAEKVQEAVENGELLVIGPDGKLYWSDEVSLEQAGEKPAHTVPVPGRPPAHESNYL